MISKTKLSQLRGYSRKKTREETGRFWVEGWRSLEEACKASIPFEVVLMTEGMEETGSFRKQSWDMICARAGEVLRVTELEMRKITESVTPPGISALVRWIPKKLDVFLEGVAAEEQRLIVAVDRIGEPGNLGTIIRTCDWFGVDALLIGSGSVELTNPKVVRSTMGSLFHLPLFANVDLGKTIGYLKGLGFMGYGAALGGSRNLYETAWKKKSLVVIGSEAWGIESDILSELEEVQIPGYGRAESLNAGVATGIFLSVIRRG
jgi:TrmH family RNA methyltransferase